MDKEYYSKYPLHIYQDEYDKWMDIIKSSDNVALNSSNKEELLNIIENAEFWYEKYKNLTEKIHGFINDNGVEESLL